MLTVLSGTLLGAAAAILWCAGLFRNAARRSAQWIGRETEAELAGLFVFVSSGKLLVGTVAAIALTVACGVLAGAPTAAIVVACVLLSLAPRIYVTVLRQKRRRRVIAQFPDALQLWAALLRSGQGMMAALSQLASQQADPLGEELRLVLGEYRLGLALDRAMKSLCERVAANDLRMLSTLLHTNRELGGNLAESLERLAVTLRGRLAMEARIRSLTAQGRMQGVIVGLLPLFIALVLSIMEPGAMSALTSTPAGLTCVAAIIALEVCGFALIRRIVRIDV